MKHFIITLSILLVISLHSCGQVDNTFILGQGFRNIRLDVDDSSSLCNKLDEYHIKHIKGGIYGDCVYGRRNFFITSDAEYYFDHGTKRVFAIKIFAKSGPCSFDGICLGTSYYKEIIDLLGCPDDIHFQKNQKFAFEYYSKGARFVFNKRKILDIVTIYIPRK